MLNYAGKTDSNMRILMKILMKQFISKCLFILKIELLNIGSIDITGHENYHKGTQTFEIFNLTAANCGVKSEKIT